MTHLNLTENDIINSSTQSLKKQVHKAITKIAFENLLEKAKTHSKLREDLYTNLKGMDYTRDSRFTTEEVNTLFKFRTRMFNVRNNFRNQYRSTNLQCPLCETSEDSQEHLFECPKIRQCLMNYEPTTISYK